MIFEKASRLKLRFTEAGGKLSSEDMWDLSITKLADVARAIKKTLKTEDDFLNDILKEKSSEDVVAQLKLDIVMHVLQTKVNEKAERENRAGKKEQIAKLLAEKARRQEESITKVDDAELDKMIDALK